LDSRKQRVKKKSKRVKKLHMNFIGKLIDTR